MLHVSAAEVTNASPGVMFIDEYRRLNNQNDISQDIS